MENHTIVTLKKGEGRTIKAGGAWIFDNEIDTITGTFTNGDIVVVHDFDGYPMGRGFINQNSKIRIRMMTRKADQLIDDNFLRMRVQNAWDYRKQVMAGGNDNVPDLNCCRVIFGEADFLPGITVDKYADVLVVECLALGMEQFKVKIVELLKEVLAADGINIRGVYERSDANERKKEGLPKVKGFIGAEFDTNVEIVENAVHYMVDVENGQKTGFFLDQKYNRLAMQRICKGKRVLDCFTHMGTFALNAGIAGASEVTGLDISEYAVKQATENAKRNNLSDTVKFRVANVLDELPRLAADGEKYDVVILDLSDSVSQLYKVLEQCTRIYMPIRADPVSQAKIHQFEHTLQVWEKQMVLDRIRKIKLPYHRSSKTGIGYMDDLVWSELGDYVREMLRTEREDG